MVTPFVRTRHATKWNTTAHLSRMRLNRHHSPDKAATKDTGEIDVGEQPGPWHLWELRSRQIYS
jgi:hypothetical protein